MALTACPTSRLGPERFDDLGSAEVIGSPADVGKIVAAETDKWAKVINFAHIKVE